MTIDTSSRRAETRQGAHSDAPTPKPRTTPSGGSVRFPGCSGSAEWQAWQAAEDRRFSRAIERLDDAALQPLLDETIASLPKLKAAFHATPGRAFEELHSWLLAEEDKVRLLRGAIHERKQLAELKRVVRSWYRERQREKVERERRKHINAAYIFASDPPDPLRPGDRTEPEDKATARIRKRREFRDKCRQHRAPPTEIV